MFTHEYYMQQVLSLARLTPLQTRPNPQVAAILVKDGQVVGIGGHYFPGGPHAEVNALLQAGELAEGATLYVNLEPCSHYGRTPPCVDALINAKVGQVVVANLDPNPLVAGQGIAKLKAAGIQVHVGVESTAAAAINQVFFQNICCHQPFVTVKAGLSLDGKIATKANLSQWITSQEARLDAHSYRVSHDAILVGVNTVLSDNPSLTPHLLANPLRIPIRIILDRKLRTPLTAKVILDKQAPTWICTENCDLHQQQLYLNAGVKILEFTALTIENLLKRLYQEQIYALLVEGGEQVYSSFLDAKAINQLVCYFSPQLIGSIHAKHLFAGVGFASLANNLKLRLSEVQQLGDNVKIVCNLNGRS